MDATSKSLVILCAIICYLFFYVTWLAVNSANVLDKELEEKNLLLEEKNRLELEQQKELRERQLLQYGIDLGASELLDLIEKDLIEKGWSGLPYINDQNESYYRFVTEFYPEQAQ